jgi:hypothetical protein
MVGKTEIVIVFPVDRGGRSLRNVGSYLRVITVCNPYDHDLQKHCFWQCGHPYNKYPHV